MRRIIMASITAVVVIAVLAGTLIPVLDDATAEQDTITNDGYYKMSALASTDTDTVVIEWDKSTMSNYILVNDEKVTIKFPPASYGLSLIFGDNWDFRAFATTLSTDNIFGTVQFYRSTGGTNTVTAFTLTLTEGEYTLVATIGGTDTTSTGTYTTIYYPSNDGAYVMKIMNESAHVFADSEIVAFGLTDVTGSDGTTIRANVGYSMTGTIEDGFTVSNWRVNTLSGDTLTHSTPVAEYTESNKWVDVLDLEKITFTTTATSGDNSADTAVTYSYFLVPAEITAERIVHFSSGEVAIFDAIPVIVIIALLLAVVAIVLRSRMD